MRAYIVPANVLGAGDINVNNVNLGMVYIGPCEKIKISRDMISIIIFVNLWENDYKLKKIVVIFFFIVYKMISYEL